MKQIFSLLLVTAILSSCSVHRYYYIAEEPIHLYEFSSLNGIPLLTANTGDTVYATGVKQIGLGGPIQVEYKGYRFYSPVARARFLKSVKVNPKKDPSLPAVVYAGRMEYQAIQARAIAEEPEDNGDWYGQTSFAAPVLEDYYVMAKTIANLPVNSPIKIKRFNENYWQVSVNGKIGYVATHHITNFSRTSYPFVSTKYTGRLYYPDDYSPRTNTPTTGAYIHTGPRGGRYYINSHGNKTYIPRSSGSSRSYRSSGYKSSGYRSSSGRGRR